MLIHVKCRFQISHSGRSLAENASDQGMVFRFGVSACECIQFVIHQQLLVLFVEFSYDLNRLNESIVILNFALHISSTENIICSILS